MKRHGYSIWICLTLALAGALAIAGCDDEDDVDDVDADTGPPVDAADVADTQMDTEVGPDGDAADTADDVADAPDAAGVVAQEVDCAEVDPDVTVSIVDFDFEPAMSTVDTGQVVQWTNNGEQPHTTTSGAPGGDAVGNLWDSGTMSPGDTYCLEFQQAGSYPYFCTIHPQQMQATMTVE